MNKLMFWEYLKDNPGWHNSKQMQEKFGVKQVQTLKSWVDPRFIGMSRASRMLVFRFIEGQEEVYNRTLMAEMQVTPQKAVIGNKTHNVPPEFLDERFAVTFKFPASEVPARALMLTKAWAEEGPEQEYMREWIREAYKHRLDPEFTKRFKMFINVVYAILQNNTHTEYLEELMAPIELPEDETLEERQAMELEDIKSRVPIPDDLFNMADIPSDFFNS